MDNLARCAMLAKKDGMSYGQWMAIDGDPTKGITKRKKPRKTVIACGKLSYLLQIL